MHHLAVIIRFNFLTGEVRRQEKAEEKGGSSAEGVVDMVVPVVMRMAMVRRVAAVIEIVSVCFESRKRVSGLV